MNAQAHDMIGTARPRRRRLWRTGLAAAAFVLYAAYWLGWILGFFDIDRGDQHLLGREAFWAAFLGLPSFGIGAAIGRWWAAVASGTVFVVAGLLGDHCVAASFDVTVCTAHRRRTCS